MASWRKEESADIVTKALLFLILPFVSFLYSLRRINTKSSYIVFFLFALLYGFCFTVIADNSSIYETADAARWRYRFEYTNLYTFQDYIIYCAAYFSFAGEKVGDLYFNSVTFFVHQFSDNYHVFFFVIALIFSFFQLKSLRFFTSLGQFDNSIPCLLLAAFFTIDNIANIGGVRFWTGAWICVYGLLQYFLNEKKYYIVLLLLLPLIHRGFFFLYPVMVITLFYKQKEVFTSFYFASFLISQFSVYILQDVTEYLPSVLANFIEAYSEANVTEYYSTTKMILKSLELVYVNLLFMVIMNNRSKHLPEVTERFYRFVLVFLTIVNCVISVPSLGERFMVICYSFVAILWLMTMGRKYQILIFLMPLFMVRSFYVEISEIIRFQEPYFFYTNPFTLISDHLKVLIKL